MVSNGGDVEDKGLVKHLWDENRRWSLTVVSAVQYRSVPRAKAKAESWTNEWMHV